MGEYLPASDKTIRVAVTQAESAWLDLEAGVQKTCNLIAAAADNGAKLISFPECWIPGYPAWIWSRPVDLDMTHRYIQNSLAIDSPEMQRIQACARERNIYVALGFSENLHNSLYIAQCTISDGGEIVMNRWKIMPTHMERTVFGNASGDSLNNVVKTPFGKVGQLACWEHTQPLLKYHTALQREDIHVAAWPPVPAYRGRQELWSMSRQGARNLAQTYAVETASFVLHTTAVISSSGVETMDTAQGLVMSAPGGGSSAIFAPDGRQVSEDMEETQETIIYADLDMTEVAKTKSFLDIVGHYSRPDLLWLGADRVEKTHVRVDSTAPSGAKRL